MYSKVCCLKVKSTLELILHILVDLAFEGYLDLDISFEITDTRYVEHSRRLILVWLSAYMS